MTTITTTNHPSGLPEQEPTSPTAVVLCDGEAWLRTAMGWESRTQWWGAWGSWGALRDFAAERGGAALHDLADLPAGLSEAQKEAVRGAAECSNCAKCHTPREALPEVFADDLVTAKWGPCDPDASPSELLRVTIAGVRSTGSLTDIDRLIAQTIAELMGGKKA